MLIRSFAKHLLPCLGLSAAAFLAAVILQGIALFPREVQALWAPRHLDIWRVFPSPNGERVVVHGSYPEPIDSHRPKHSVQVLEATDQGVRPRPLQLDFSPWTAAASPTGRLFLVSNPGTVYSLDLRAPQPAPCYLGTHPQGLVMAMFCSDDGSLALATNRLSTTVWRSGTPGCLWQRADLDVICARFVGSSRLYCGIAGGEILELCPQTGAAVQTYRAHYNSALALDVTSDGKRMAVLCESGRYVISDLASARPLWEGRVRAPGAAPRFSPDGTWVLTPAKKNNGEVLLRLAETGEVVGVLIGLTDSIKGIAVAQGGIAFAWDHAGAVAAWHLRSGRLLRRFNVKCPLPRAHSSCCGC